MSRAVELAELMQLANKPLKHTCHCVSSPGVTDPHHCSKLLCELQVPEPWASIVHCQGLTRGAISPVQMFAFKVFSLFP